jgi:hypothetical protein
LVLKAQEKKKKTFKKIFKGDCQICGRKGHKAADCWESDSNKEKRPSDYKPKDRSKDPKPDLKCLYCSKTGHLAEHCFSRKRDEKKNINNANFMMIAIDGDEGKDFQNEMKLLHREGKDFRQIRDKYNVTSDTFIIDSGATLHMRFSPNGMMDYKEYVVPIKVGNASLMYSKGIGTYHGKVIQKDGSTLNILLKDVLYVPEVYMSLFLLTKVLNNESIDIRKERGTLALMCNNYKLLFDRTIKVGKGKLLGIDIIPNINIYDKALMGYVDLHQKLGHANEQVVKKTAKKDNI